MYAFAAPLISTFISSHIFNHLSFPFLFPGYSKDTTFTEHPSHPTNNHVKWLKVDSTFGQAKKKKTSARDNNITQTQKKMPSNVAKSSKKFHNTQKNRKKCKKNDEVN